MNPQTFGRNFDRGKIVPIKCVKCDRLTDLDIRDSSFLLMIVYDGAAYFQMGDTSFEAIGPCVVCFDETISPSLEWQRGFKCDSIYFHPTFLNVNMTFSCVHSECYDQLALTHDLFLLKPFTSKNRYVFPVFEEHIDHFMRLFSLMETELRVQSDWYWSCRSRSYFIEMMLLLERTQGLLMQDDFFDGMNKIKDPHLKKALIYIASNYRDEITLQDLVKSATLNHSSLTEVFKAEMKMTPIEYLWNHRLAVAKKFLEFTNLPIKDIALRCGFKTTQHFSRKFEKRFDCNPSTFRMISVEKRKKYFTKTSE